MHASVTASPKIKVPECVIIGIFSSHFQTPPTPPKKILVLKYEELLKAKGND